MKDWKGNKKSVSSMLGMSTVWNPEQRAADDFYATDPVAVEVLIERLQSTDPIFRRGKPRIYECACGEGNISKALESMGYEVISTDLVDRGYGISGIDFLKTNKLEDCAVIITNPPYKYANEFILHALELLPVGGEAIFLMNISYLSGKQRFKDIYSQGYLDCIYIFSNRICCYKNNIPTGHSSPVNYAWFVFRKKDPAEPILHTILDWLYIK